VVRQTQTYLASAVSGTILIALAIVAAVLLVSSQAFRDWPLSGLPGLGGEEASEALAPATPVSEAANAGGPAARDAADDGRARGTGPAVRNGGSAGEPVLTVPASASPGAGDPDASPSQPTSSAPAASGRAGGGGGASSPGGSTQPSTGSRSASGQATGAVNEIVAGADQGAGGTLGDSGVTEVTESAVNGVAGPESVAGKSVDEAAGAVDGVLGADG
jgi:hypothetical protein